MGSTSISGDTMARIGPHGPAMTKLLIRVGVLPPDTPFNRRAAAYAKESRVLVQASVRTKARYRRMKAAAAEREPDAARADVLSEG